MPFLDKNEKIHIKWKMIITTFIQAYHSLANDSKFFDYISIKQKDKWLNILAIYLMSKFFIVMQN